MVKNTYKIQALKALVASKPDEFVAVPDWETINNRQAVAYAHLHGYSWNQDKHVWFYSPLRVSMNKEHMQSNGSGKAKKVFQIRVMGHEADLKRLAGELGEVVDLIGYRVTEVSAVTSNGQDSTWGRIYITLERM